MMNWIDAKKQRPKHLQRCLCYDSLEYSPKHRIYVYDDISKYWVHCNTIEHDSDGNNHISDYADYRITHWMSLEEIDTPHVNNFWQWYTNDIDEVKDDFSKHFPNATITYIVLRTDEECKKYHQEQINKGFTQFLGKVI